jgi:hypothetical protein
MDDRSELGNLKLNIFEKTLGACKSRTSIAALIAVAGMESLIISLISGK